MLMREAVILSLLKPIVKLEVAMARLAAANAADVDAKLLRCGWLCCSHRIARAVCCGFTGTTTSSEARERERRGNTVLTRYR
jgi:hypothetical protein